MLVNKEQGLFLLEDDYEDRVHETWALTSDELVKQLKLSIERAAYGQDFARITGIWQYRGRGRLEKLQVVHQGQMQLDNDYTQHGYTLKGASQPEIKFTVTIDGRA